MAESTPPTDPNDHLTEFGSGESRPSPVIPDTGVPGRPNNPYVGPRAFRTGEALYGRDREVRQLLDLLVSERIVLLHSPSGAGKTSLIHAGLIPRLEEQGFRILPVVRVNQELPAAATAQVIDPQAPPGSALDADGAKPQPSRGGEGPNRYIHSVLLSLEEESGDSEPLFTPEELLHTSLKDYLARRSERNTAQPTPAGFAYREESLQQDEVLIFDQFEEILTTSPTDQEGKEAFFEQMGEALRDRQLWALFAIREDYLAALSPYLRPVPTRFRTTFRLDLLGVTAALQAIQEPARTQGVEFVESAARRLVDDLRKVQVQRPDGSLEERPGPYVEPVQLQVVCFRLWGHLDPTRQRITEQDLEGVGDVNESLAGYYSESVAAVAQETGVRERQIREWFQRELITEAGVRSQVIMGQDRSGGLPNAAIRELEDAHVLRAEKRRGVIWFELAHDRLVAPVRTSNALWFHERLSLLQRQAGLWQDENRPDRLLLRGEPLAEAEQWATANPAELLPVDSDFLAACQEERQREQEERQRAEQAVKLEEQARLAKKLRQRLVLASIAALIAVLFFLASAYLGVQANTQRQRAEQLADENATNASIAQSASTLAVGNAATAEANAQLAQAASTQASNERATALAASTQAVAGQSTAVAAQATSEYNAQVAATEEARADEQAEIAQSRQLASQSRGYLVTDAALASLLAVEADEFGRTNEARSAMLTSLQSNIRENIVDLSGAFPEENNAVYSVAISPDGRLMAWGLSEGSVRVWDQVNGRELTSYKPHRDKTLSLEFSPDGRWLASGGNTGETEIYNLETGETYTMDTYNLPLSPVFGLSYSADGTRLAVTWASEIWIYDVTDPANVPERLRLTGGHTTTLLDLDWDTENLIASGGRDETVIVWDTRSRDGQGGVARTFTGHTQPVEAVAISSDGTLLASAAQDGTVLLWDVANGTQVDNLAQDLRLDFYSTLDFSADGQFLAAGGGTGLVQVWKLDDLSLLATLQNHQGIARDVSFIKRPGTNLLASGGEDGTIALHSISVRIPLSEEILAQPMRGVVLAARTLPDATLRLAVAEPNGVAVYTVTGSQAEFDLNYTGNFTSAAFSPEGSELLLGSADGSLRLVSTTSPQQLGELLQAFTSRPVTAVAFHPDGERVGAGSGTTMVAQVALTPEQQGQVVVYNLRTGERLAEVTTQILVTALAFNPAQEQVITGDETGGLQSWNLSDGTPAGVPLNRHRLAVTALAFDPETGLLASGSADRTIILWDLTTAQAIGLPLVGHAEDVSALEFAGGGTSLYSGDRGGALLRWDTDPDSWKTRLCNQANNRQLSEQEWSQFMPEGYPYEPYCQGVTG
jgi:WD40 repeat protein